MINLARRPRRSAALIALVVIIPFIAYAVIVATRTPVSPSSGVVASATLRDGSVAPTKFTLLRLGGSSSAKLAELVGHRPAIINFFASWCTVCQSELDAFGAFERVKSPRIQIVGIDTNDHDPGLAMKLLKHAGASYPVLVDTSHLTVALAFGIGDLPVTFFVSSTGHVIGETLGGVTLEGLRSEAATLLAASPRD